MSCKYKYNNQWYTKEEVFNLLLKEKGINSKGGLIKPKITNNKIEGRTNETLKESIGGVKKKILSPIHEQYGENPNKEAIEADYKDGIITKEQRDSILNGKEYTEQALINTKIAALKEVAKKYPRSLIRSEVKPISQARQPLSYFEDDMPFQKIPVQITEDNKVSVDVLRNDNQSLQEGLNWLKSVNPNVQPEIVQGLIDGIANGSYNSNLDLITLSEEFANKKTVKHEFLHKILASLPFKQREAILNEASKKYGIARGESKTTTKYSQAQQNEINYSLKAVDLLQSDKAKQVFDKGKKVNWDLNKILTELSIPKEQKELILNLGITDREQIALELASNYSYAVEINTAKENKETPYTLYKKIGDKYVVFNVSDEKLDSFDNKEDAIKKVKEYNYLNTKHYSNLTVPGGTNYTENAIQTPNIINISTAHINDFAKGIANMLGWFRSDDKAKSVYNKEEEVRNEEGDVIISGGYSNILDGTKTRRILEVQSDLFQKGRDKKNLITSLDDKTGYGGNQATAQEYRNTIGGNENQFLQLLNKDNNWVTFFIKSILQDSAKQGYEKVLFPTGNTASKVEGHATLEEEINKINLKIDALKNLKNTPNSLTRKTIDYAKGEYIYTDNVKIKFESTIFNTQDAIDSKIIELEESKEDIKNQGVEKLKPIYNFYENTVTNILNKTYGKDNVKVITDEYGNTWNEIDLSSEKVKQQTDKILFQSPKLQYTGDLAIEEKIAEEAENSKDEIVAKTPLQKFIQSIKNLLRNIFKERDKISRLLRDMNQGRLNSNYKNNTNQDIKYQLSKEQLDAIDNVFDENPELANEVYSKILTNSGLSAKNLLSLLLKENLIEKQCS